jgi:hypothetical protein
LQAAEKLMFCIRARPCRLQKTLWMKGHGSAGRGKTHVLCQGTTLQAAENSLDEGTLCRPRKTLWMEGHAFAGRGKTHVLYQGTTLQAAENSLDEGTALHAAEKLMFCVRARLYSLRKNSLDKGHGFAGCRKTHVLCQGTTLVGPKTARMMRAFSP